MIQREQAERTKADPKTEPAYFRPAGRMMKAAVPKKITGTRREAICLTFRQDISDARVEFKYSNDALIITSGGRQDRTFGFHFTPGYGHVRRLEMGAKLIEKESQDLLTITCCDSHKSDELQEESHWVKLLPGVSLRDIAIIGPSLKLIWAGVCNQYFGHLLILIVVFEALFHYVPKFRSFTSEHTERAEIHLGVIAPYPYAGNWEGVNSGKRAWGVFPAGWNFGIDPKTRRTVLTVKGSEVGLSQLENPLYGFFDFVANFDLRYLENQKSAAWIIHAKNRGEDYYLFTMTFPTDDNSETAILEGSVYRNRRKYRAMDPPLQLLQHFVKLTPGDRLYVTVRVLKDGQFENCIRVNRAIPMMDDFYSQNTQTIFHDPEKLYPYGAFGFRADDQTETEIDGVTIEADPVKVAERPPCINPQPESVTAPPPTRTRREMRRQRTHRGQLE